jgi:hypothetical protein
VGMGMSAEDIKRVEAEMYRLIAQWRAVEEYGTAIEVWEGEGGSCLR